MSGKSIISNSYLEDIADAIRYKKGTEETFYPSQMGGAIRSIEGIVPTGTMEIDANGVYDVTEKAEVDVDVNPDLRPLAVSENGTYQPDGFDGYSEVSVDVYSSEYSDDIEDFSGGNVLALISHAQEYINTGYYPKIATEYYIKAHKTTNYQRYENLFSALFYDVDVRIGAQFVERSLSEVRFYYAPTSNSGTINTTISNEPTILSTRCPFLEISSAQELSHIATHPLLIFFGYYRNGYDTYKGGYNFYGFKCYENKKLVKKYVPWLDDNNVPCVHELVDDEYFYNVGTGAFGYIDLEGNEH